MSKFTETLAEINRKGCAEMPMAAVAVMRRSVAMLRKSGLVDRCLQREETAPDFVFNDQNGKTQSLYQLLKDGPVVVSFFRGFWCPFCKAEFEAWQKACSLLAQYRAKLIAIAPKPIASQCCDRNYFSVSDEENKIANQFGVLYSLSEEEKELFASWDVDIGELDPNKDWQLPLPSTYLIGMDRTVLESYVEVDYKLRLDPADIVVQLEQLNKRPLNK